MCKDTAKCDPYARAKAVLATAMERNCWVGLTDKQFKATIINTFRYVQRNKRTMLKELKEHTMTMFYQQRISINKNYLNKQQQRTKLF